MCTDILAHCLCGLPRPWPQKLERWSPHSRLVSAITTCASDNRVFCNASCSNLGNLMSCTSAPTSSTFFASIKVICFSSEAAPGISEQCLLHLRILCGALGFLTLSTNSLLKRSICFMVIIHDPTGFVVCDNMWRIF